MNLFKRGPGTKSILFHILAGIEELKQENKKIMAGFADIQIGIADLGTAITDGLAKLGTDIAAEIDAIVAKLTPPDGQVVVAQTDVDSAVTSLTALKTSTVSGLGDLSARIEAETAALSTPPAPAA
jgi:hypothetical protein